MKITLTTLLAVGVSCTLLAQETTTTLGDLDVRPGSTDSRLPTFSTSATLLDSAELDARNAHHLQDALGMVPNLNAAGGSSRPRYLQLRGVGENSHFASEGPPNFSVGFLIDDIDLSGMGMAASLFDVESVEVLRGPQATVYGSQALAGLVNIVTKAPTAEQEGQMQVSFGTDEYIEAGIATGGAVTEDEAWTYRLALNVLNSNGYRKNVFLDRDNTNGRKELNGRLKLRYTPDEDRSWDFTILGALIDNGYDAFSVRGDGFTTYSDEPGKDTQDLIGGSARMEDRSRDNFDLVSITSVMQANSTYSYDADWANDDFWAGAPYFFDPAVEGWRYSFYELLERRRRSFSQDIRLQGKPESKLFDTSTWSAGISGRYMDEKDDYVGFAQLKSDYEMVTAAGYGQLSTELSQDLTLITSVRLENRETEYRDDQGVSYDTSDVMAGGRASLELALSDVTHAFATVARGFKGSGVNQDAAVPEANRKYDPEYVWNYETGIRSTWADGQGHGSITLFYMDREDLQITSSIQSDPGDPTAFAYFTDNAVEGQNYGLEADIRQPICENASFFASLGLLETEYKNFSDAGGSNNIEGREQPMAPAYTFLAGLDMFFGEGWFARAEIEGKDEFFFSDGHDQMSSAYELINLKLGYAKDNWSVTLWGRNVTDESYDTRGFFFGQEPPNYEARTWTMKGDPAQFGITFRQNF